MDTEEQLNNPTEEELRTTIIHDYGFDEALDADKIDKMVQHELDHTRKLSAAIGQKIKQREEKEEIAQKLADAEKIGKFSTKDVLTLAKAEIELDDLEVVENYARFQNVAVADAINDPILKGILTQRKEMRTSARAAQTQSPRMATKTTGETWLQRAKQDQLPTNEEDIEMLVGAHIEQLRNKKSGA